MAARDPPGTEEMAASNKTAKYAGLMSDYHFQPIAVESLGPANESAIHFLTVLGKKIAQQTGDERETAFSVSAFINLSAALQLRVTPRFFCSWWLPGLIVTPYIFNFYFFVIIVILLLLLIIIIRRFVRRAMSAYRLNLRRRQSLGPWGWRWEEGNVTCIGMVWGDVWKVLRVGESLISAGKLFQILDGK